MKKLSITTIVLSILFCLVLGLNANAATIVESGSCGTNVTYTLDSDGVLTISGSGAMTNYSSGSAPWYSSSFSIKTVIIEDGVTRIGSEAFYYCSSLTNITIPDSVTKIGRDAFYYCSSLTNITIPDSVTSIGNYAFGYCSSLPSITIPDSVTSIGVGAFGYCSSLPSIAIPESVTSIEIGVFNYCSSLTSITIPNSVTSIGNYAFYGCSSLPSITIPDSVTSIEIGAFGNCSSLPSITIPDSVTSIGSGAFEYCSSLTSITIPNSVTIIDDYTFENCSYLTSITLHSKECFIGSEAFGSTNLTDIYYIGSEEEWLEGVFASSDNDELTSATVHYNTPVVLEKLLLDKTSLSLTADESYTFKVSLIPSYAPASQLVWSSSNTEIATVDQSGKVKALKDGTAVIKVTTEDGGYEATCTVTINPVIDIKAKSIAADGTEANITFAITWGDVEQGTLFVGVYDDKGILTGMGCVDLINVTTSIKVPVYYPAKPKTYKAFMWNNPTDMEPVLDMCEGSF